MDNYTTPTCECGGELYHWQEEMHTILTPITKSGFVSKIRVEDEISNSGAWDRLRCKYCCKEYDYTTDDLGRIIVRSEWIE